MDKLTAGVEVLKAGVVLLKGLAWPLVFVFIAIRYHEQILTLLEKLSTASKAKGFGMEFEFERKAEELAQLAAEIRLPASSPTATADIVETPQAMTVDDELAPDHVVPNTPPSPVAPRTPTVRLSKVRRSSEALLRRRGPERQRTCTRLVA
ncbi:hypothetical protein [Variovorax sp. dw_308]|uniref:hypothetical protein n=1 Tax=Variovorax sp. dw_308 TaxID=2721546 RepID=UPI001C494814|nr:hypothetical protein [Variovorax sp. dw_308]